MNTQQKPRRALRLAVRITAGVAAAAVTLGAVAIAGALHSSDEASAAPRTLPASIPSAPLGGGRVVVAVVLGSSGTDAADALGPYDVFARSDRFSVYTVAASRAPLRLDGGLTVRPTFSFADVASGRAADPDVVVVPAVDDPSGRSEADLRQWVVDQARRGAQILGVCAGARVLAASGVLDGHRATSHWSRIPELERSRPQVDWISGQRYIEDGRITTTAGVTSGIPGALRVLQRFAGDAEANRVGREVAFPAWSLEAPTAIPVQRFQLSDAGLALNLLLPWFKPTVGLALGDGVDEIDAVAAVEVYSYSSAARVLPVGPGTSVRSAHGLVLGTTPAGAARFDRSIRPASFEAALADLGAHTDGATVHSTAKMLEYPLARGPLLHHGPDLRVPALLAVALSLAVLGGMTPALLGMARRRRAARAGHRPTQTDRDADRAAR